MNTRDKDYSRRDIVVPFDLKEVNTESGTFEGYGSVFGNVDSYGEIVAKGAFKKSLRAHKSAGTMPALLWMHKSSEPIGVYADMREDDHGLYVKGELIVEVQRSKEALALMKRKAVSGLSIGFVPEKMELDEKKGLLTHTEVDLWEVSVVTFPANPKARIESVKQVQTIRDLEECLREEGVSNARAKALASQVWRAAGNSRDEGEAVAKIVAAISSNTAILKG